MSLYPILWAVEHAPIVDAEERAILVALVSKGDFDGCNCYRSFATLARVAQCDRRTAMRKVAAMTQRGLMRPQAGPKPKSWLKLPKDKRPVVREVMVPASFWSAVQLEEINEQRADRGRLPITPAIRPDLSEAPPKKARADKGVPNPKRSRKKKATTPTEGGERGDSETPRSEDDESRDGVTSSHLAECLEVTPRGVSESPNPLLSPSASPSSLPAPPVTEEAPAPQSRPPGREDESSNNEGTTPLGEALSLVDAAVRLWPRGHKAPSTNDRQRLAQRVAAELATGGEEHTIIHELSRDMSDVGNAMKVMMGNRTKVPGWGKANDPRPDHSQYEVTVKRPWCGQCSEGTRMVHVIVDEVTGDTRPKWCSTPVVNHDGQKVACHPKGRLAEVFPETSADMSEIDPPSAMSASLEKAAAEAKQKAQRELAAVRAKFAEISSGAEREKKARAGSRR